MEVIKLWKNGLIKSILIGICYQMLNHFFDNLTTIDKNTFFCYHIYIKPIHFDYFCITSHIWLQIYGFWWLGLANWFIYFWIGLIWGWIDCFYNDFYICLYTTNYYVVTCADWLSDWLCIMYWILKWHIIYTWLYLYLTALL